MDSTETAEGATPVENAGPFSYRNWRALDAGEELSGEAEYPLFSDADIVAEYAAGPYAIINTIRMGAGPGLSRRPALVLRTGYYLEAELPNWDSTDDASYHGGLLEDEIAALASLRLGIRLKAGGATREGGKPVAWSRKRDPIVPDKPERPVLPRLQPRQSPPQPSLDSLASLTELPQLSVEDAVALVRAARLYQEAVWIAETAPELSWLMLVSALETAADRWRTEKIPPIEILREFESKVVDRLIQEGGEELATWVAKRLAKYIGSTRRFVSFVLEFLPDPPEVRPAEAFQHPWDPDTMEQSLKIVYKYRSHALHAGTPFPMPMCESPHVIDGVPSERPIGATSTLGAVWLQEDIPILLHTFEYVARGALNRWWDSLSPLCSEQ